MTDEDFIREAIEAGRAAEDSENLAKTGHTFDGRRIKITGGVLREECKALLKDYKRWLKTRMIKVGSATITPILV